MPWVKLTDDWYDDPAIIEAGDDGGWLWLLALSWSARNLTDGHVPSRQLSRLTTLDDPPTVAARLVDLGLLTVDTVRGGWVVANYHRYQPTAAEVMAKREAEAERKRAGRQRVSERSPGGRAADSGDRPTPPVPGPGPVGKPSSSSVLPVDMAVFEAVADRRMKAEQSKGTIRTPARWRAKVIANLPAEIGDTVRDLNERFDEPAARIAEVVEGARPTTGLRPRLEVAG